jgi:uncharacterized protein
MTENIHRIATLDIVRGVAVMGILAMNIVGFAMPMSAYINPTAYGSETALDYASYAFSFILIDGKMRGLFSFLFGASMLLVIEKAAAKGERPAAIHFRRQLWLMAFGLIHFYLIWFGDILFAYGLIGMLAWFFRGRSVKVLIGWGIGLVLLQFAMMAGLAASVKSLAEAAAQPGATAETLRSLKEATEFVRVPDAAELQEQLALYLGSWSNLANHQWTDQRYDPLIFGIMFGPETLAYMLFGMAALKSGFLTGGWDDRAYTRTAVLGFGMGIPVYAVLVWLIFRDNFSPTALMSYSIAATVPFRPFLIVATAALVLLLTRPAGRLTERIAAAGRAAFTNYLGTSLLMTALFYGWGFGRFGEYSRVELWLVVIAMWLLMLVWSKPWLERFQYGPFEWLWRSLSRWQVQPLRR